MKTLHKQILMLVAALFVLPACVGQKSYVDPRYGRATYGDIIRRPEPYKLKIVVEFQRNGKHLPQVDKELMEHVERIVRGSGFAVPASESTAGELKVIVNNVGDVGKAAAKGFSTGLTLGLVGSTLTDNYEMEAILSIKGKVIKRTDYKHAIHTTVGRTSGPEGAEPMTVSAAFGKVVEQLILNFLNDVQRSGELSLLFYIPLGAQPSYYAQNEQYSQLMAVTLP